MTNPLRLDRLRNRCPLRGRVRLRRAHHAEVSTVNIDGTRTLIDAAKDAGVRRVIVTSSSVTSGSSADGSVRDERYRIGNEYAPPYFLSKVRQEHVAFRRAAMIST